jgi:hypothetical protein
VATIGEREVDVIVRPPRLTFFFYYLFWVFQNKRMFYRKMITNVNLLENTFKINFYIYVISLPFCQIKNKNHFLNILTNIPNYDASKKLFTIVHASLINLSFDELN